MLNQPPGLKSLVRWTMLGLALLIVSCENDGGPQPVDTLDDSACTGADCVSMAQANGAVRLSDAQLERILLAEKARIERNKAPNQVVYDSLKVLWQDFLDGGRRLPASVLLRCDPLQYVAETKIVGPEGGNVDFGPHKLRIPPRALRYRTVITAEAPTSLEVTADFSPHRTRFLRPVELQLSYKHCNVSRSFAPMFGVYLSDDGRILEYPRSQDRRSEGTLWVWPEHFSKYAVAY